MADSAISYHQAAQAKQERRRAAAQPVNQALAGDKLASLHDLGMKLFGEELNSKQDGDRDFSTVAIGHLEDRDKQYLLVVAKGMTQIPGISHVQSMAAGYFKGPKQLTIEILVDPVPILGQDNLHAEMAIVQAVHSKLGISKGSLSNHGLQIACISKGVCPDCSGWLTRHNIPHTWRRKNVSTTGWSNPTTGASFKGKGDELRYVKQIKKDVWLDTASSKETPYPKG